MSTATAAFLSTAFISLAPNILLFLMPSLGETTTAATNNSSNQAKEAQMNQREGSSTSSTTAITATTFLSLGQAMAAGGLMGDVFLHILSSHHHHHEQPQQSQQHGDHSFLSDLKDAHHHPESDGDDKGLWVLAGFTIFFATDLLLRTFRGGSESGSHHHSTTSTTTTNNNNNKTPQESLSIPGSTLLLNLVADALHNFTDGLAIGASYSLSSTTANNMNDTASEQGGGLSSTSATTIMSSSSSSSSLMVFLWTWMTSRGGLTSLSILFHEIPHELGDYCTLRRAGYTKWQAIRAQFVTALAAFAGTGTALVLSSSTEATRQRLLLLTAGGFVYVATVTLLPDVLEQHSSSAMVRMGQFLAFCTGIAFLYFVSIIEELEEHQSHEHHHEIHLQHGDHHHHEHFSSTVQLDGEL